MPRSDRLSKIRLLQVCAPRARGSRERTHLQHAARLGFLSFFLASLRLSTSVYTSLSHDIYTPTHTYTPFDLKLCPIVPAQCRAVTRCAVTRYRHIKSIERRTSSLHNPKLSTLIQMKYLPHLSIHFLDSLRALCRALRGGTKCTFPRLKHTYM